MNRMAMIVSVISIIGWLALISRNSQVQRLGFPGFVKYAAIWGAIIIVVVLVIQYSGVRIGQ